MSQRLLLCTAFGLLLVGSLACHHHDHYYEQSPPPQEQPVYQRSYDDDYDGVHVRAPFTDVNVRWKKSDTHHEDYDDDHDDDDHDNDHDVDD